uniref:Uncharacterized protein n=1 Tax=Inkyuleea mariana TaxID=123988 RepID=A0A4D6WZV1_9FLOR|nr:hypothetical protein [Inkyuleea mariana]
MNLLHISFSNQYLNSPITWLHKLQKIKKIYLIFIYLFIIPYFNYTYISINLLFCYLIISNINIPKQEFFNIIILALICIIIFFILYNTTYYLYIIKYPTINIYIPSNIILHFINHSNKIFFLKQIKITSYLYHIPEFIIKISLIIILYFILLKILFLSTQYEYIIISFLIFCNKINYLNTQKFILVSAFASQFLEIIIININNSIIAVKLRNSNFLLIKYELYYYIIVSLYNKILNDIYTISSTLYMREINYKKFQMINIYDTKL